jgi:hypothetical protein
VRRVACAFLGAVVACSGSPMSTQRRAADAAPKGPTEGTLRLADIGKECTPESPATVLEGPRLDSLPLDFRSRKGLSDELWVRLAREVPGGVGGIFADRDAMHLWLVDPSRRSEAIAALEASPLYRGPSLRDAVVLKARWDFAQLADWYAYVTSRALPGVRSSSSDIQEARNRLEFGVVDEAARAELESRLKNLGLPCNLIAIEIRPPAVAL